MGKAKVKLHGGPADGRWIDYHTPLPKTLVIPEVSSHSTKFHDYERISQYDYEFKESQ